MKFLTSLLPGHEQIESNELALLRFKADAYDRIDNELNRGLAYTHRIKMSVNDQYYDGMESAYVNIYKELRKNELREGKDHRNVQSVQTGSDDLPW